MGKSLSNSELENFQTHERHLHLLDHTWMQKKFTLDEMGEMLPGLFHVNSLSDQSIQFMGTEDCAKFQLTPTELKELGIEFLDKFINPMSMKNLTSVFHNILKSEEDNYIIGNFQGIRFDKESAYDWHFTSTKISKERGELISISSPISLLGSIGEKMENLIGENLFIKKNYQKFSTLTTREKQILKLVATGKPSGEIGEMLSISKHTVSTHRKNIIRKLEVKNLTDLIRFAQKFEIID